MAIAKINGRSVFLPCDDFAIAKVSNGRWECDYGRAKFLVIGGRQSGGRSNEWFVQNVEFFGQDYIAAGSMAAAIRLGVQY